ncbi:histidine phosphatase family protein [Marinobacterium mangrovicola]|uniref:phosphoglycerate mutase (2,3-diphosphoglycerate-dependent) n=1 Tax=Marinobacterium mangrovicola TaxID=1476959 RepID=A0A4V2PDL9_9GAMM|nr:histidine phosphatase family protein [Marinobacterium mangrovicola]TCK05676.1 putative phosphoglycerate mutase [Marinobacterium mangrovicola]
MSDSSPFPSQSLTRKPFVFMRHGETETNAHRIICGASDVALSKLGEQQALSANWLDRHCWSCVATSGLYRARRTAHLAVPRHPLYSFEGLNERHWGSLELAPLSVQTPYEETPPDGEPWSAFRGRVLKTLNRLLAVHELPLVVAHSGVYRVIRELQTGTPHGPRIDNAQPVLIEPVESGWQMTTLEENWLE